jgi:hypothetical protein
MILSNDPRYGSYLTRDQGQSSILDLVRDESQGQLVVGRTDENMINHVTSNYLIHGIGTPNVSA